MQSNAGCWRRRLAVLVIATSWLTGCATGASEPRVATVCPPVVQYSRELQARAAEELALLPDGSAVVEMMGDYAVMREQGRECGSLEPLVKFNFIPGFEQVFGGRTKAVVGLPS